MQNGSEFKTAKAAPLQPWEVKVVRTRGTDDRLVFEERRERVGMWYVDLHIIINLWDVSSTSTNHRPDVVHVTAQFSRVVSDSILVT